MHGLLLAVALSSALIVRHLYRSQDLQKQNISSWNQRWINAMFTFILPPLLLMTSAIALVWMGPRGMGISAFEGWGSYGSAIVFLLVSVTIGYRQFTQAHQELQQLRQYPTSSLMDSQIVVRTLPLDLPFIAQIGFWNPEIILSQGILEQLTPEQLQAVLAHEKAHATYHDTFWFFSFGWLRRLTFWLPKTDCLWQELLLLRELRADRVAAQTTDPLVLAEALVTLVRSPMVQSDWSATLNPNLVDDRFSERIEAILEAEPLSPIPGWQMTAIVLAGLLPLITIPFHHG
jgi:Zn-dependent protease with chaperone function